MTDFAPILSHALFRKGGEEKLEEWIREPLPRSEFLQVPDHRVLSTMTLCVFQAGFVWRVIRKKWPDFERVFFCFRTLQNGLAEPRSIGRYRTR